MNSHIPIEVKGVICEHRSNNRFPKPTPWRELTDYINKMYSKKYNKIWSKSTISNWYRFSRDPAKYEAHKKNERERVNNYHQQQQQQTVCEISAKLLSINDFNFVRLYNIIS